MVVSNTTTLIYLCKLNRPDLLKNTCTKIVIPQQVYEEIMFKKERYKHETALIDSLIEEKFIEVVKVTSLQNFGLDKGENAAISLCLELKPTLFFSDDKTARDVAERFGFTISGSIGVLLRNVALGKLTKKEFMTLLNRLLEHGFYLSTSAYSQTIKLLQDLHP